jgi:hypothetical protein
MVAPPVDDGSEAELHALEREWMEAWRRRDRATCERLLAPDFLLTSARGVLIPRLDWLENAMGAFVCEAFEWLELVRVARASGAPAHPGRRLGPRASPATGAGRRARLERGVSPDRHLGAPGGAVAGRLAPRHWSVAHDLTCDAAAAA